MKRSPLSSSASCSIHIISAALVGLAAFCFAAVPNLEAAGVRGEIQTEVSWIEMRGFVRQEVSEDELDRDELRAKLPDGTVVTCIPGLGCYWYSPGQVESTMPFRQNLRLTGWSNIVGLSGRLHVRGRYGSDDFWPRSSEEVELVTGYLQWDRDRLRLQAGRTSKHAGLGYHEFDGGTALWRMSRRMKVEVYGGRSLARGTSQPLTGFLLEQIDDYAPNEPGLILGAEASLHFYRSSRAALLYHREIRVDREGLYEERGAFDAHFGIHPVATDIAIDYDFSTRHFNDAGIRFDTVSFRGMEMSAGARYRRPHFGLWTVWEAFSPVGYTEGRVTASWAHPSAPWGFNVDGSYREYEETHVGLESFPVRDDRWRMDTSAHARFGLWRVETSYGLNIGFGAAEGHAGLRLRRTLRKGYLGLRGFVFQQAREFRHGDDWIFGGGFEGKRDFGDLSLSGTFGWHRLSFNQRADYADWSQRRARLGLTYRFGQDPGLSTRKGKPIDATS